MLDIRPVAYVIGLLLLILALSMTVPAATAVILDGGGGSVFLIAAGVTAFFGLGLILSCHGPRERANLRHVFLLAILIWVILPIFAALPFRFGSMRMTATDAFFEAMSGLTTTGATAVSRVEDCPRAILIWRALLQWLGGIGIVLTSVSVLPMLRVGGMQVFLTEAFDSPRKLFSRPSATMVALLVLYAGLTLVWTGLYWWTGMDGFDALAHAMTTLSTGGFSTASDSLTHWGTPPILIVAIAGMLVGALPFPLLLRLVSGRPGDLARDSQSRVMILVIAAAAAAITAWLIVLNGFDGKSAALHATFNTVAFVTGTGYASTDVQLWSGLPVALLFILQYVGGCAGSSSCGFKIFRFQILYAAAKAQVAHMLKPHMVSLPMFDRRPLAAGVTESVMAFFFIYALSVSWLTMALSMLGLDFITAFSGASTAISNVGAGFGDLIRTGGGFAAMPDAAKWLLSLGMLIGRLEILLLLVPLQPAFWRE